MLLHKVIRSIIYIPRLRILWTLETMLVKFAICLASDSTPSLDQTSSIHWAKDNWVQSETWIYKITVNQYSAAFLGIFEFYREYIVRFWLKIQGFHGNYQWAVHDIVWLIHELSVYKQTIQNKKNNVVNSWDCEIVNLKKDITNSSSD